MKIAVIQAAPVFLDVNQTTEKAISLLQEAAATGAHLCVFPEVFLSGYPIWLRAPAVATNDALLKKGHIAYLKSAITADGPELSAIATEANKLGVFVYVGFVERNGSGGSVYASLAVIHPDHGVITVHRKMKPTFYERLIWSDGDGHGLQVHQCQDIKVGALNCYENWLPLARQALYAQGEQLHIATWPGDLDVTEDVSRFIAMEGRVYVASASGLLRASDIPQSFPLHREVTEGRDVINNGGSMIVDPGGKIIAGPVVDEETILTADIDLDRVLEEHLKLDPAGHYNRGDVLQLTVNRKRLDTAD
ncbi:MAG: carbon-nitrogen hydrolase family protein [Stappiaceae bacterium]